MSARVWFWAVTAVYAATLVVASFVLPERVPLHFGADGSADRYGSRVEAVVTGAALGVVMVALFAGLAAAATRKGLRMLNVPHKEYWLVPEREAAAKRMVTEDLYLFGAMTMGLLVGVELFTIARANDPEPTFGLWGVGMVVVFLAASIGYALYMAHRRYRPR